MVKLWCGVGVDCIYILERIWNRRERLGGAGPWYGALWDSRGLNIGFGWGGVGDKEDGIGEGRFLEGWA